MADTANLFYRNQLRQVNILQKINKKGCTVIKLAKVLGTSCVLTMIIVVLVISVCAYSFPFSGSLPSNSGDTEISTVAKANGNTSYFNIHITSMSGGYSVARAWTEVWPGINVSNNNTRVSLNTEETVRYSSIPASGNKVTLNLDNPASILESVSISGTWDPN